jgi:DNA-binding CsgD family transcriptional regulator
MSNVEAAAELGVSPLTLKKHLENIYLLLGVSSRSAAVARLLEQMGWIPSGRTLPSTGKT